MNDDTTYEVWIKMTDGKWARAADKKSERDLWPTRQSALAVAGSLARDDRIAQVIGIKRTLSFTISGKGSSHGTEGAEVRNRLPDEGRDPGEPRG